MYISTPQKGSGLWSFEKLNLKSYQEYMHLYVKGFGQGLQGEMYVLATEKQGPSGITGKVLKLVAVK